jgi:hypothetical protein
MGQFAPLRKAAVAGSWYPSDPDRLRHEVDTHLAGVDTAPDIAPTAVVAPHAGLLYSGPIAAHAYQAVQGSGYDVAVLVGPSHFVGFDGVSVYAHGAFATPLGPAVIDEAIAGRFLSAAPRIVVEYPRAHEREHSLEMQLPFIRCLLPDTPIVPLVMGFQTRETIVTLARVLAETLAGTRALMIASTDLSHYFDAVRAAELDARVVGHVGRFDWEGLLDEMERYPEHERGRFVACGGGPAVSVMHAARALGATRAAVLKRADSGDVSGDKAQVVGYMAAVFGEVAS